MALHCNGSPGTGEDNNKRGFRHGTAKYEKGEDDETEFKNEMHCRTTKPDKERQKEVRSMLTEEKFGKGRKKRNNI